MIVICIITALASYFLGSSPTGYLVARAKGVDIRSVGSGNIGATNVFRILGKGAGIFVLTVDGLKGYFGCSIGGILFRQAVSEGRVDGIILSVIGALGAILGHNYTCWLRFKGGKGIATSAGALVALLPYPFLCILSVWLVVFALSRYVSLASIAAAAALPFSTWYFTRSGLLTSVSTAMSALAIYKHRANIERLLAGKESRIGRSKT